jgi:hypothetical protein
VREKLGLGKHALHISDTHEEVEMLCELFMNKNSRFFLNNSKKAFLIKIPSRDKLKDREDVAITSSFIMDIFGIRKANDLDYIINGSKIIKELGSKHNCFFSEEELKDLIYNPKNFFRFKGIKFLTLENVAKFKRKREEPKDRRDLRLIESFLDRNKRFDLEEKILKLRFGTTSFLIKIIKIIPKKPKEFLKKNKHVRKLIRKIFY